MEETLQNLEKRLEEMGDFRRGTISVNYHRCGQENCICTKPGHPGHGPQFLWNTTAKGKSYAKGLKLGPELRKYMEETANDRNFLKLCEELVELSEKICDLRPVVEIEDKNEQEELKKITDKIVLNTKIRKED